MVDRDPDDGWFRDEEGELAFMIPIQVDADMNWPDQVTITVEPRDLLN